MSRLQISALSSLLLHAALLLTLGGVSLFIPGHNSSALTVQLMNSGNTTSDMRAQAVTTRQHGTQIDTDRRTPALPDVRRETVFTSMTPSRQIGDQPESLAHTEAQTPATAPPPSATTNSAAEARSRISAHLHTDLARYFHYPDIARQRGWEGRVLLAFDVESDGQLRKIHVAQSSGFSVLDSSALSSIRRVERLAESVTQLHGRRLAMQIPVIYRLEGDR